MAICVGDRVLVVGMPGKSCPFRGVTGTVASTTYRGAYHFDVKFDPNRLPTPENKGTQYHSEELLPLPKTITPDQLEAISRLWAV